MIEAEPSVQPLLAGLLNQTLIVPDLDRATEVWRESVGSFDLVTLAGEMLSRHGVFTGGSANGNGSGKAPGSILGRKNQIAELRAILEQAQEHVNELSRRKGTLLSEQTSLQAGLQEAQTELRQQEVAIATQQGEFNALENSGRLLHQKIDTVIYEIQSLAAQEEEGSRKRAVLVEQAGGLEQRESDQQQLVSELAARLEELRRERDRSGAALTETKVALASEGQICSSLQQQQQSLAQRLAELFQLAQTRRAEVAAFLDRKVQAEGEIQSARHSIEAWQLDRGQVNARVAGRLGEKGTLEAEIGAREGELREERRRLTERQQQRGGLEVELAQKSMGVENLRERIQQKYHLALEAIRSECITITFAQEGPPKVQTLTPEEMAAGGVATDWPAIAEQVSALQQRIDEMGPVNLVAIEEYEETEQRHTFLTTQYDDLVRAKAQLLEVINRINLQTREMFTETFEKIRENFRVMFTEVFDGGKADLLLVGEGDALESGIDIVARPPGKQLQTISLLSGGEQTMTAVALLFSIYQVKPSPFCVLDELDAPLDESNINRFIRVLQRFLVHSQFIIITHNKRTIGMADILYGVTMEEHGISKIVSVKFHKAGEAVADQPPALLVPPATGVQIETAEDLPHLREETIDLVLAK